MEQENWNEYDKILTRLENLMKAYFPQLGVNPEIEKWRQDEPVITARWIGNDGIERNIQMSIFRQDGIYSLKVGASAWRDNQATRERKWIYREISERDLSGWRMEFHAIVLNGLLNLLENTFLNISSVTEKNLTMTNNFPPNPAQTNK